MALEYINLNPNTATSDEIIDAISNNEKVYDQISKKIKELKKSYIKSYLKTERSNQEWLLGFSRKKRLICWLR